MSVSFAQSRAQGSQLGVATPMPWKKRGRTAPVNGDECATKFHRILNCAGRGTGLHRGEREFSTGGRGNHGAGPAALSSLPLSISRRFQSVSAGHRTGFQTASEMRLFWGQTVPFRPILSHLFLLIWSMRNIPMSPTAERKRARRSCVADRGPRGRAPRGFARARARGPQLKPDHDLTVGKRGREIGKGGFAPARRERATQSHGLGREPRVGGARILRNQCNGVQNSATDEVTEATGKGVPKIGYRCASTASEQERLNRTWICFWLWKIPRCGALALRF